MIKQAQLNSRIPPIQFGGFSVYLFRRFAPLQGTNKFVFLLSFDSLVTNALVCLRSFNSLGTVPQMLLFELHS
jgi:hypothetical protein